MRFHPSRKDPEWIVYRDDYYPHRVAAMRQVPGARWIGWQWVFPRTSWPQAARALRLRPAHCYPYLTRLIPRHLTGLFARLGPDRVELAGPSALVEEAVKDLEILCGYEQPAPVRRGQPPRPERVSLLTGRQDQPGGVVLSFPEGLRRRIGHFLRLAGASVQVEPEPAPPPKSVHATMPALRDYQRQAVMEALARRRGTLVMPTGAGKTRTAAGIIAAAGQRTLFLVQSRDLVRQTVAAFQEHLGLPIGVIVEGKVRLQEVTVATVQSLLARTAEGAAERDAILQWLGGAQLLIVDEGHGLGADTVYAAARMCRPAYAFALTATPQREDRREVQIEAATGPVWRPAGCSDGELVERGYLLPVKVTCVPFVHGRKARGRTPAEQFAEGIAANEARNHLILRLARTALRAYKTIVLVKTKEHGEHLAAQLGIPFVHGATKDRGPIFEALGRGTIRGIVATPLLEQGVDIPEAECLIDAVPRRSAVKILQTIGRVRRPAPGKTIARVVTVIDLDGGPFERAAARKLDVYEQAGFALSWLDPVTLRPTQAAPEGAAATVAG
ncbi:DEAD/DEAH box helicase [Thermaerobacter litoralis]